LPSDKCFRKAVLCCALAWSLAPNLARAQESASAQLLNAGYRQMYNLDFDAAHQSFQAYKRQNPQDPLGPVSNAAAYLFSEFNRLHILEADLFTDDQKFESREKLAPDSAIRAAFDSELDTTLKMADEVYPQSPGARDAMFAKILANGLRGDYLALIEGRDLAGLEYMKAARVQAESLVAQDSTYYDAYLAIGVENYLLGVTVAPVRWILRLTGAETDKDAGIANLRRTADKGHYLAPYARLLLAVAALRDRDRATARNLLSGLAREFPQNGLYEKELSRIPQ
jgi:hypothetical protein